MSVTHQPLLVAEGLGKNYGRHVGCRELPVASYSFSPSVARPPQQKRGEPARVGIVNPMGWNLQ